MEISFKLSPLDVGVPVYINVYYIYIYMLKMHSYLKLQTLLTNEECISRENIVKAGMPVKPG